jgi:monovalent cation:H+ antiporter-2, CPA2 family
VTELGPLATGYLLVLAVAGPVLTRLAEPGARGARPRPPAPGRAAA